MFAYYLHTLDPFIVRFTENFGLRWYGLAYVLGFLFGYVILLRLSRRGYTELKPEQVGDFITWCALLGVMLGGRLGYMLLYDRDHFFANPLIFFNILGGGMASHGGILGLVIFTYVYARRHKISWPGLGDNLVVVAPAGIFFGRIANFINGELYGRISHKIPWAFQFPTELRECSIATRMRVEEALPDHSFPEGVIAAAKTNPEVQGILRDILDPRHPSQIYQALLEGALLFAILLAVRLRFRNLRHGVLTGLFFVLYAVFRVAAEMFRQRDATEDPILHLNPGQFYSLFMILIGIAFFLFAGKRKSPAASNP